MAQIEIQKDPRETIKENLTQIAGPAITEADVDKVLRIQNWPLKIDVANLQRFDQFIKKRSMEEKQRDALLLLVGAGGDYKAQLLFAALVNRNVSINDWFNATGNRQFTDGFLRTPAETFIFDLVSIHIKEKFSDDGKIRIEQNLKICEQFYPQKYPAFLRDLGRVYARNKNIKRPDCIPEVKDGDYENPFQLKIFSQDPHEFTFLADQLHPDDPEGKNINAIKNFTQIDQIYKYILDLSKIDNHFKKNVDTALDIEKASMDAWSEGSEMLPEVPVQLRVKEFLKVIVRLTKPQQIKFIKDYLLSCLDDDPQGTFIYAFSFHLKNTALDESLLESLFDVILGVEKIRTCLLKIIRITSAPSVRYILNLFAGVASSKINVPTECLLQNQEIINALIQNDEDSKSEIVATKLFSYALSIFDGSNFFHKGLEEMGLKILTEAIILNPVIFSQLITQSPLPDFENEESVNNWIDDAQKRIYILSVLSKENVLAIVKKLAPKKLGVNFKDLILRETHLPSDFDQKQALTKIKESKSWAPPEPRLLIGIEGLPNDLQIFIEPHPQNKAVDSWRISFHFIGIRQSKIRKGDATADFVNGKLEKTSLNDFSNLQKAEVEKIGIYLAYEFFIRHPQDVLREAIRVQVQAATDQQPHFPDLDEEPIKTASQRKEMDLTLDARNSDQIALRAKRNQMQKVINEGLKEVQAALFGQKEVEPAKLLLFKRHKGLGAGEFIYERIAETEVKDHLSKGTLSTADYYVLDGAPYMKAAGYYPTIKEVRTANDETKELRGITQKHRSENAEMAYAIYQDSKLPDLSEFRTFETTLGILVEDPDFSNNEFLQFGTEGEELGQVHDKKRLGLNSQLAMKMHENGYLEEWFDSQIRVLKAEMKEIEKSSLPEEQKTEQISLRENKIKSYPELIMKIKKRSQIVVSPEGKASVMLPLGWMQTETTFNAGKFVHISKLTASKKD